MKKFRRRKRGTKVERLCVDILPETNDYLARQAVQQSSGIGQILDNLVSTITKQNPLHPPTD